MKKLTAEHEEFITALVPEVRDLGQWVFWGFLGVWLLKACQDQGRAVLGLRMGLMYCPGAWMHLTWPLCLRPPTSGWLPQEYVLMGLSGQVILCTKEVSVGARKNAFALLVEMGHAFLRFGPSQEGEAQVTWGWGEHSAPRRGGSTPQNHWSKRKGRKCCLALDLSRLLLSGHNPPPRWAQHTVCGLGSALVQLILPSVIPEALQRYLILIYPGLVGAVTMVSCSILALTHLLFEFKGKCDFFESMGSPQGRKMPRRLGHYQMEERSQEGGRKAGAKPSHLPSPLLPSLTLPPPHNCLTSHSRSGSEEIGLPDFGPGSASYQYIYESLGT